MAASTISRLLRFLLAAIVLFGAGMLGVYIGSASRGSVEAPTLAEVFPSLKLLPGAAFPDLPLVDEDNVPVSSHAAVGDSGAIVIFVDLGCPPCEEMTGKFQALINGGELSPKRILGIAPTTPVDYLSGFYTSYGLTFPIYADTAARFMHEYGVQGYPIVVVVDANRRISHAFGDSRAPIDGDMVADWLEP